MQPQSSASQSPIPAINSSAPFSAGATAAGTSGPSWVVNVGMFTGRGLSPTSRAVADVYRSRADQWGYVGVGVPRIAREAEISERSVYRSNHELEATGVIEIAEHGGGRQRVNVVRFLIGSWELAEDVKVAVARVRARIAASVARLFGRQTPPAEPELPELTEVGERYPRISADDREQIAAVIVQLAPSFEAAPGPLVERVTELHCRAGLPIWDTVNAIKEAGRTTARERPGMRDPERAPSYFVTCVRNALIQRGAPRRL
jgi:hypothetical protein